MRLDKAGLLKALELKTEVVTLDAGDVVVSEIGAADYINLWTDPDNQEGDKVNMAKFIPKLVARSVVDDNGNRLFTDADAELLARSSSTPFMLIADVAKRLNGLAGDEIKNSEPSPALSSSSDCA